MSEKAAMAADPAGLPVGETALGRHVARLAMLWRREIDAELRPFGLTDAQWRPLYWIGRLGGPTQAELARALDLEAPSVVRLIDALERAGLAGRIDDPADRRLKRLHLTQVGHDRYAQIERAVDTIERRLLENVTAEEHAVCVAVLARVENAIRARAAAVER